METDFFDKHELFPATVIYPKIDLSWADEEIKNLAEEFVFVFTKMELEDMVERGEITSDDFEQIIANNSVPIEYDTVFDHGVSRRTLYLRYMRGKKNGI